jgi:DNA-binding beta-propeller fold protein YncE
MIKKLLVSTALVCSLNAVEITKLWESESVLKVPESVLLDKENKHLFVANINGMPLDQDGNGFISILNLDGTVKTLHFTDGLDAPKGMAIYDNKLYVSDIDDLRVIDLASGKLVESYHIKEAKFLNDVAVTKDGTVFVSDFSGANKAIYKLENKKMTKWMGSGNLLDQRPNGLWVDGDSLVIGTKSGIIFKAKLDSKQLSTFAENIGVNGIDGILPFDENSYISSDWAGRVFISSKNNSTKIIDGASEKINSADIWYDMESNMLYSPTFFDNRILAYEIK